MTPRAQSGWYSDPWEPRRLRYFDGHQWTEHLAPIPPGSPTYASNNALRNWPGRPFGESTLKLQAITDGPGADMSCSVDNVLGARLAVFACRSRMPLVLGRDRRTLEFELLGSDGAPQLRVTRIGGGNHRLEARDAAGADVGRLRQVSSNWRLTRTATMVLALESRDGLLGSVDLSIKPSGPLAEVPMPIRDTAGLTVATVGRNRRKVDTAANAFGYTLSCPTATAPPLTALLLLTAFTLYLYDRVAVGGPIGFVGRWISRPTWEY